MEKRWLNYEQQIHRKFQSHFPHCTLTHNELVTGIYSRVPRQVDISIRGNIEGFDIFGIIECKCLGHNIDVSVVDRLVGFMEDVRADFGYIITTKKFSEGAINRANVRSMHLQTIRFMELEDYMVSSDDLINEKIQALTCIEQVFMMRQQQSSAFIDLSKTSLGNKVVVFKQGFVTTPYYAHKKLLTEVSRVFRDFPCIGNVRVIIPLEGTDYFVDSEIRDLEAFLEVSFVALRNDIGLWRNFLDSSRFSKDFVTTFAAKYVKRANW